jgi:hypothetical protein
MNSGLAAINADHCQVYCRQLSAPNTVSIGILPPMDIQYSRRAAQMAADSIAADK